MREYFSIVLVDLLCVFHPCRIDRYTPLACAAKAGNYDIMAYLLSIKDVTPEGVAKDEVHIEHKSRPCMITYTHSRTYRYLST